MKVLVVGSGGREHALGYKLSLSPKVKQIYFAPGNGGTCELGTNLDIKVTEVEKIKDFALANSIDLVIIGPELPLELGITDLLKDCGIRVFGPDKKGAMLETSKIFSKQFMIKYGIPTAGYHTFKTPLEAGEFIQKAALPIVVKADGLASGKGVYICNTRNDAEKAVDDIMVKKIFGGQGGVVVEEFLQGKEVSLLCFTDGHTIVPMQSASDYKRAFDNDQGPNTGGMGSISPSPYFVNVNCDEIVTKTLTGIKQEGFDYSGVIYIGLMLTDSGPKVLEYNVRFGDPETQALMPRLESDFFEIAYLVADKKLNEANINWAENEAVTVIIASNGYPGDYKTGEKITLPKEDEPNIMVFHSGTKINRGGELVSNGGRVLAVTATGKNLKDARKKCYGYIDRIHFSNSFHRKDIGELK